MAVAPHEQHLGDQLDRLRDGAKTKNPDINLPLFVAFLEALPENASGVMRFRAKANIGLQYLQRGDADASARWLLEAYEEAPHDRRAIANRSLALWLQGDAKGAYSYGREQLAQDEANEILAGYLPQFAANLPEVTDCLDGIPDGLRQTEAVTVAQAQSLRMRDVRPDWWQCVRDGEANHPASLALKVMAALSSVDEIARDADFQRTHILSPAKKEILAAAVEVLDGDWRSRSWLLQNPYDDAQNTLAAAMIAHHFLHDTERTLERVRQIADAGIETVGILVDAVTIAHALGDVALAKRLIARAPRDRNLAFQAAVIAVQEDDWDRAVELYGRADIPESERRLTATVLALAPLLKEGRTAGRDGVDRLALKRILGEAIGSPRSLVMVASVASELGAGKLARRAFKAAVDSVNDQSHIATRLMVAAYAERVSSAAGIIRLLDGHLPFEGFEREHERLAVAHANERPHRRRNLSYFQGLPLAVRQRREIARAHASVLLNIGRVPEALSILQRLHGNTPTDAFVALRLLESLHRTGDRIGFDRVLERFDLAAAKGSPEYIMQLAHLVARAGAPDRAYPVAYDLVRRHRDNPEVALGYLGLGLLLDRTIPGTDETVAQVGSCVSLRGPGAARVTFVIDDGEEFFSMSVRPPSNGMAQRVIGRAKGDTIELPKLGLSEPDQWVITEVTSKYVHLHRQILEGFEVRFPDRLGISKFTVEEGKVGSVLDMVRRRAEHNRKIASSYMEQELPLAFVARLLGGDVLSFADYVRTLGGDIVTCRGGAGEREEAMGLAREGRGAGVVLDPYTAWVAADIGVLPDLKAWFGSVLTPASTIGMIDRLIDRERESAGQSQMTIAWHDGQFFRQEITDADRDAQVANLTRIRDALVADVEIREVLVPDDISRDADQMLRRAGSHFLDAAFLAAEANAILLSDDMRYRQLCSTVVGVRTLWLQASLLAALEDSSTSPVTYASAVVGLSAHRHGHVALTGAVLYIIAREDDDGLPKLRRALTRLAGPTAEMTSHIVVLRDFLRLLWLLDHDLPLLKMKAATGLALSATLAHRKADANAVLQSVAWQMPRTRPAKLYLNAWLRGHFITLYGSGAIERPAGSLTAPDTEERGSKGRGARRRRRPRRSGR